MSDQHILESLLADIDTAQQLLSLLDQEFEVLSGRDLEALQLLLAQKQPALRILEQHASERSQLLLKNNATSDLKGFQEFAARSPLASKLLDSSTQLNTLLEQCQAANLRNGRLIRSNQTSVNSMLNIIRGTDTPSLYDKTGSAASTHKQRPFSQA